MTIAKRKGSGMKNLSIPGKAFASNDSRWVFTIPGDPVPLARPRFSSRGVWDGQKQLKVVTGITLTSQMKGRPTFGCPIQVEIEFIFQMPRSKHDTREGDWHASRPDLDNLVKYVLDVGNTILFTDDCVVSKLIASKSYGKEPKTIITITKLERGSKGNDTGREKEGCGEDISKTSDSPPTQRT